MSDLHLGDLRVVDSPGGTLVHLATPREVATSAEPRALCSNAAGLSQVWFALNGCKRCAKAAIKADINNVIDVDVQFVTLADVLTH